MRVSLRWKILLLVVLSPVALAAATLVLVHRDVHEHVDDSSIHESLQHSVSVFEGMLATRSRALAGGGQVVAQDPRFFSLLMLGVSQRDARFTATVRGMAADFNRITQTDVFEVFDRRGRLLASVGEHPSSPSARSALLQAALAGRATNGVLVEEGRHYQAVATPVRADGRVIGVLMLGASISTGLASELRNMMHCEVTFLSEGRITGTTQSNPKVRKALLVRLDQLQLGGDASLRRLGVWRVQGGGQEFISLIRRIPGTSPGDSQYYVLQREFDPEVRFQHAIQQDLIALAAVALILAILSALFFSGLLIAPLNGLVRAAREMERGNYDEPIAVRRGDEIGYLAERFARMRQQERAYVASLEQTAQLKTDFIRVASHELRTPLSVIDGYVDLIGDGSLGTLSEPQQRGIDSMRQHLARLKRVAEDASLVAQVQGERLSLELQSASAEGLVRRAVAMAISSGGGRRLTIETLVDEDCGEIVVDDDAVSRAIRHLVTNAIRFTEDGGRITVHAAGDRDEVRVTVTDTGMGMGADVLLALRTHGLIPRDSIHHQSAADLQYGSRGLGLGFAIARGVVEAHGGRVEVESTPGEGTRVTLHMPRGECELAAA